MMKAMLEIKRQTLKILRLQLLIAKPKSYSFIFRSNV